MRRICDYRAPINSRTAPRWRRRFIAVVYLALGAYLFAYGIAYQGRAPAANLAFWCYGNYDEVLYVLLYPAYWLHQRLADGQRHNNDRAGPYTWPNEP